MKKIKLLMPILATASLVGAIPSIASCSCSKKGSVELSQDVTDLGVKVKSFTLNKGQDSTIEFELPTDKVLKSAEVTIGNEVVTEENMTIESPKLTIKAAAMIDTKVYIKGLELGAETVTLTFGTSTVCTGYEVQGIYTHAVHETLTIAKNAKYEEALYDLTVISNNDSYAWNGKWSDTSGNEITLTDAITSNVTITPMFSMLKETTINLYKDAENHSYGSFKDNKATYSNKFSEDTTIGKIIEQLEANEELVPLIGCEFDSLCDSNGTAYAETKKISEITGTISAKFKLKDTGMLLLNDSNRYLVTLSDYEIGDVLTIVIDKRTASVVNGSNPALWAGKKDPTENCLDTEYGVQEITTYSSKTLTTLYNPYRYSYSFVDSDGYSSNLEGMLVGCKVKLGTAYSTGCMLGFSY